MKILKSIVIIQIWLVAIIGIIFLIIRVSVEAVLLEKILIDMWVTPLLSTVGLSIIICGVLGGLGKLTIKILELGNEKQD